MQLGLVTYDLARDWDLPTLLANCRETGFEAVELRTTHAHGVEPGLSAAAVSEVRARIADSGIALWGLGTTCEYDSPDPAVVAHNVEESLRWVDLAAAVGARGIKVRPNCLHAGIEPEATCEQIGTALAKVGAAAAAAGVLVYLEVHGGGTHAPKYIKRMLEVADNPAVGACWNSNLCPEEVPNGSIATTFPLLAGRILSCHITELWNAYPWADLFARLQASGYNGATLCEIGHGTDPLRLMRYYRALWLALQPA